MGELKSSYELAMEKLRGKGDSEEGVQRSLSPEQKQRIAEIRMELKAKLAERDIMLQSAIARLPERTRPEDLAMRRQELEREYVAERRRLEEECDAQVRTVREESA